MRKESPIESIRRRAAGLPMVGGASESPIESIRRRASDLPPVQTPQPQPQPKAVSNADPTGAKMRGLLGIGEPPKPEMGGSRYDRALKKAADKRKASEGQGLGAMLKAAREEREATARIVSEQKLTGAANRDQTMARALQTTGGYGDEGVRELQSLGAAPDAVTRFGRYMTLEEKREADRIAHESMQMGGFNANLEAMRRMQADVAERIAGPRIMADFVAGLLFWPVNTALNAQIAVGEGDYTPLQRLGAAGETVLDLFGGPVVDKVLGVVAKASAPLRNKVAKLISEGKHTDALKALDLTDVAMRSAALQDAKAAPDVLPGVEFRAKEAAPPAGMVETPPVRLADEGVVVGAAKEPWQMTREEFRRMRPLPEMQRLPDNGDYAYLRTDDGSIYYGDDKSHVLMAERLGIPKERIESGGFINDGVLSESGSSSANIARLVTQEQAKLNISRGKTVENALKEGKPVPAEVLADYPDLAKKYGKPAGETPVPAQAAQTGAKPPPPVETPKAAEPAPTGSTAAKNAVTNEQRQQFGLGDLPEAERVTAEEMIQSANKAYSGDEAARVRAKVDAGEAVNSTEQGVLLLHREALGKRIADGDKSDALLKEFDETTLALKRGGSETARTLAFRRFENELDMDALTIRSKYVEALDRPLTKGEAAEAEALAGRYEDFTKRIEELTARAEKAEADLDAARTVSEMSKRRAKAPNVERIRERRSEAVSRLKEKWAARAAEKEDGTVDVASGFTPEEFKKALLLDIAPEIIEIAKSIVDEGVAQAAEVAKRTAALLKAQGVDIDEADVKAVIGGKVRAKREEAKKAVSDWQKVKGEVSAEFRAEREANLAEQRRVKAELAEADRAAKAEKKRELAKLQAEEQWRRMVEKEWNADVARREAAWRRGERAKEAAANRKERKEYTDWWKQSTGGKRAKLLNDIDRLQDKLVDLEAGKVPESKLREDVPPEVQDLYWKREALRVEVAKRTQVLREKARKASGIESPLESALSAFSDYVAGPIKSVVASLDISAPLTQGGFAMFADPKNWGKALAAVKHANTKEGYDLLIGRARSHRHYDKAVAGGLELPALQPNPGEDTIVSAALEGLRPFGWSSRQYAGYLTELRLGMFSDKIDALAKAGPLSDEEVKWAAETVMTMTGRSAGFKPQAEIGRTLFAARYYVSMYETAFMRPVWKAWGVKQRTGNSAPLKMALKKYAFATSTIAATAMAAKEALGAAGYDLDLDPRSTDFGRAKREVWAGGHGGKRKVNQYTIDVLPPQVREPIRMVAQFAGGKITATGDHQEQDFGDLVGGFASTKSAPTIKMAEAFKKGDNFGDPYNLTTGEGALNVGKSVLPISVQGGIDIWNDKTLTPLEKILFMALLPFGRSVSIRNDMKSPK